MSKPSMHTHQEQYTITVSHRTEGHVASHGVVGLKHAKEKKRKVLQAAIRTGCTVTMTDSKGNPA